MPTRIPHERPPATPVADASVPESFLDAAKEEELLLTAAAWLAAIFQVLRCLPATEERYRRLANLYLAQEHVEAAYWGQRSERGVAKDPAP